MFSKIQDLVIACSESWWKIALLIAGFGLTFGQLIAVTGEFPALALDTSLGEAIVPFDMQNDLTPTQLFAQLAVWSEQSFARYSWFQAVDFLFPLVGGLMSATLAALGLRLLSPKYYSIAVAKKLFLLFFIATCFDWLENAGFIWVLAAWPEESMQAARFAITAKKLKLFFLNIFQPVWVLLLLTGTIVWLYRKLRGPSQPPPA